jgi:hypothetical protein
MPFHAEKHAVVAKMQAIAQAREAFRENAYT